MNAEIDSSQKSAALAHGEVEDSAAEPEEATIEVLANVPVEEPSVGERLRAAREAKGMTSIDVAARLKLSPHQVDALECDDWTRLQCNTITRGFVRNYARLVGLDAAELMLALDQLAKPLAKELAVPASINVKVPTEHGVERRDYVRVAGGLIVLLLAILAYFFLPTDYLQSTYSALKARMSSKPAEVVASTSEPERQPAKTELNAVVAAPNTSVEPAPSTPATAAAPASAPTPAPASTPASAPSPAPAPAPAPKATPTAALPSPTPISVAASDTLPVSAKTTSGSLKLSFTKPSWVEIKDRTGQIIFSQLSPAGSQREVSGQPPFVLVIGNAANVSLQYKGKEVDLSKRSKDDVARLTLE